MNPIQASMNFGVTGEYRFVTHGGTRGTIDHGTSKNLILNSGIDALFANNRSGPDRCWVGTSNAAVVATQTDLQGTKVLSDVIQSTLNSVYVAGPPPYIECTRTYRFTTGVATGTWAEVGTGWNDGTGQARFSRALILPSAVTVLSDEQLDVTFTVRFYPSNTDVTGTVSLEGTPTDYVLRFGAVNSGLIASFFWGAGPFSLTAQTTYWSDTQTLDAIGATSANLGALGGNSGTSAAWNGAYVAGTFTRTLRITLALNQGNIAGGIGKLTVQSPTYMGYGFQSSFTPKVNKTASKVLTLDYSMSLTQRP